MKAGMGIVTLTTDFGTSGSYVAAMKGVLLGLAPSARLVDVSHALMCVSMAFLLILMT